jgi:hypothetical protein
MSFFVVVLCVLCVFVVKSSSVAVLHRICIVAARKSTTPCLLCARRSRHVEHQIANFRPSAPLPSLLASFLTPTKMIKIDFNVIKCNHFYGQLPPTLPSLRLYPP